jgi:hypothetical protein
MHREVIGIAMTRSAPIIAAILLLLPVLYVGSYLALVVPNGRDFILGARSDHYRIGGKTAAALFSPLESIDRRLRDWDDPVRRGPVYYGP